MKFFRVSSIALMLFMLLISAAGAYAQQGNGSSPPPAGSGLCTDGTYLFMLRGHSIQPYTVADMTLVKSVELPKPEPPTTADLKILQL
jgi:hypothetical protein